MKVIYYSCIAIPYPSTLPVSFSPYKRRAATEKPINFIKVFHFLLAFKHIQNTPETLNHNGYVHPMTNLESENVSVKHLSASDFLKPFKTVQSQSHTPHRNGLIFFLPETNQRRDDMKTTTRPQDQNISGHLLTSSKSIHTCTNNSS